MNDVGPGWGWPSNSPKAHYFPAKSYMSLCGTWMYASTARQDANDASPDNCKRCARAVLKLRVSEAKEIHG